MKVFTFITLFAILVNNINSTNVCGHVFGFPNNGPIQGVNLKLLGYTFINVKTPTILLETISNTIGAFCFENVPGNYYVQLLVSKMFYMNLSTPTIQIPSTGCLLPELNIQLPGSILIKSLLFYGGVFGVSEYWSKGCLFIATVTRPCHGMYSTNSHGLEGALHKILKLNESTNDYENINVSTDYLGVTRVNHPLLPDSTCFFEIFNGECTQLPNKEGPHSWDGGVVFWNLDPGKYKLTTFCNGTDVCPNDTIFQDVFYDCQTNSENIDFSYVNASPSHGPRPISGVICEELGESCGSQIPDPYNRNPNNEWRKELREKCNMSDEDLFNTIGKCEIKHDPRWSKIEQKTNKETWLNFSQFLTIKNEDT